jgi:hypothetical protein
VKPTLFQGLKRLQHFRVGSEQQEAFDAVKEYIQKLRTMVSPQLGQQLILYVLATQTVVSGAIVQEIGTLNGDKKMLHQVPIYFVSKALVGSKKYYSKMEKICYIIVISARKL